MTVQPGLCQTWLETQIVGFLMHRLSHVTGGLPGNSVAEIMDCHDISIAIFQTWHETHNTLHNFIFIRHACNILVRDF